MIGHLAAAAGLEHGETGFEHVGAVGAGAGGVERRVLDEPDQLRRRAGGDGRDARVHDGEGLGIGDRPVRDQPFDRGRAVRRGQAEGQIVANVNHSFTMPW